MADHDQAGRCRRSRSSQHLLEPYDTGNIEMVGRLIHDQQIRLYHQRAANCHPFAPATRQPGNRQLRFRQQSSTEHGLCPALLFGRLKRQIGQCPQQVVNTVEPPVQFIFLGEETHHQVPAADHLSMVLVITAGDDLEQRRLPGTVRADQTDPIALGDNQIQIGKQKLSPKGLGH